MIVLLAISSVISLAYLCLSAVICKGIPVSLSATYYTLGRCGWLFQLTLFSIASCVYPVWWSVCSENVRFLPFIACVSLIFVSVSPSFKMKLEGVVHYMAAAICCSTVFLWQILDKLWDVTLLFCWVALMISLQTKEKWCWWLECAAIGSLMSNLWLLV